MLNTAGMSIDDTTEFQSRLDRLALKLESGDISAFYVRRDPRGRIYIEAYPIVQRESIDIRNKEA